MQCSPILLLKENYIALSQCFADVCLKAIYHDQTCIRTLVPIFLLTLCTYSYCCCYNVLASFTLVVLLWLHSLISNFFIYSITCVWKKESWNEDTVQLCLIIRQLFIRLRPHIVLLMLNALITWCIDVMVIIFHGQIISFSYLRIIGEKSYMRFKKQSFGGWKMAFSFARNTQPPRQGGYFFCFCKPQ